MKGSNLNSHSASHLDSHLDPQRGRIHSIETCGTVDGPGIRFVIFTQGCRLRCQYCHNPDTRDPHGGKAVTVDELIQEIRKYRTYMKYSGGGVTVSGGEPLLQPEFVREIFRQCQAEGIHTALDTSGYPDFERSKPVLDHTDLVLLDIKSFDPKTYHQVTQVSIEPTLHFAKYLSEIHKPVWIRFVLVPGLTDAPDNIAGVAQFASSLSSVERVDILPFHQMAAYKWEMMGYHYLLKDTPTPTAEQVQQAVDIFGQYGLSVS
ncbi:pyruvate formate-lyase-activating protein [cf. Phormidesmis sp. LEGE 11477]|uniref:pyruvate formate-lyase-activating protein n=1 Tax=cf. Phormidesmis sp. LEGE 11477 TaxID=1828680 RepID=UPI00187E673C|nr:pyruvate formate-lyase-activating protein [cf. Phormidesmis sp. LEGE 11477]MBE9059841.1 pyruvate formate lyase-activating protein [cf. Phormidesmis sp. LEGE 11477]